MDMRAPKRLVGFVAVVQSVLFLTHYLLYETWRFAPAPTPSGGSWQMALAMGLLSVSFVSASLLAFRYSNSVVRVFYQIAAVWLGLLTFLFVASLFSWFILAAAELMRLPVNFHRIVEVLFAVALGAGF